MQRERIKYLDSRGGSVRSAVSRSVDQQPRIARMMQDEGRFHGAGHQTKTTLLTKVATCLHIPLTPKSIKIQCSNSPSLEC